MGGCIPSSMTECSAEATNGETCDTDFDDGR